MEDKIKLVSFVMNSNCGHSYHLMKGGKKGKFMCAALDIDIVIPYDVYERAYMIREATMLAMSGTVADVLKAKKELMNINASAVMKKVLSKN